MKRELARLQRQQIDEINQLLGSVGITERADSIDNVNFLFSGLNLSGGRKQGNPGNQGDDVKYIYNFIFTFFRSKYIWKSTAYFFIFS